MACCSAGQGTKDHHWDKVLPHTDYALFCIKSPDPDKYLELTKRPMANTLKFWDELEARGVKYWVRGEPWGRQSAAGQSVQ